ncbi:hypothetical protein IB260_00065 [Pseudomonas sp. PDM23]|uniref:hypothetical protein n=2 Tax=unclassified Pseudomonas TaxID=196821 RepID=UPI00177AE17F|nr:hypothetical protein [Pseudomonas sp. PDM23]MBD9573690.1 hypothetical protein [Pseudomonas sp. PDM23]
MQVNISDIWGKEVEEEHCKYLQAGVSQHISSRGVIFKYFIMKYSGVIGAGRPDVLRGIIKDVELIRRKSSKQEKADFIRDCHLVLDYGRFTAKGSSHWNAYALCNVSKYRLCPYCQQSLAVTIFRDRKSKSVRPTLDHFYSKSKYPYLALSLYNLIPSCYQCNSSLKGNINFYAKPHLHPYEDEEIIKYDWDFESYMEVRGLAGSIVPPVITIRPVKSAHSLSKKVQRSLETFLVKERLDVCRLEVDRFVESLLIYSEDRLKEVNDKVFSGLPLVLTPEVALDFSRSNYKNEWLGAVKRDLYDIAWGR